MFCWQWFIVMMIRHHHCCIKHCHLADEVYCVVALLCSQQTAHLQRSPVVWLESSQSWWSHLQYFMDNRRVVAFIATSSQELEEVLCWHEDEEPCVYIFTKPSHTSKESMLVGLKVFIFYGQKQKLWESWFQLQTASYLTGYHWINVVWL